MNPCDKCIFLMSKSNNECETYFSYLKIGLAQNNIQDICNYIQKNKNAQNIKQLCTLISTSYRKKN